MMKMPFARLMLFLLVAQLLPALKAPAQGPGGPRRGVTGDTTYRLEYQIRGGAISRLLLFFPIRVFYDAAAAVDLTAHAHAGGATCFTYAGVPRPAYILRTLGFSGKTLALLTVDGEEAAGERFAGELLSQWRQQEPELASRVKTLKKFPHRLTAAGLPYFAFERDDSGFYRNIVSGLEARYRYHPAKTGIYFNVFPMLADLLRLFNHPFAPAAGSGRFRPFPAEWTGDALDLSGDLNRAAGLLEKIVKSLVTVQQKAPFHLRFRVTSNTPEAIEICGECYPDVSIWKGFMIREMFRRVRLRPADRALLEDEIWIGIRNNKGQGGFGHLILKLIN
ncbi:MAG TPA: hypothetical protein VF451_06605, partial [Acidobacteriota bacterium]